jgi:hypothetical protein
LNNDSFWLYLFLMCRVLYAPMRVLCLADQQTVSMDKLYFYVLQTDPMLIKWLPDCKKKATELLRDTSLGQVMINCDADIDWGSNKEEYVTTRMIMMRKVMTMIQNLREMMKRTAILMRRWRSLTFITQCKYHCVHH